MQSFETELLSYLEITCKDCTGHLLEILQLEIQPL